MDVVERQERHLEVLLRWLKSEWNNFKRKELIWKDRLYTLHDWLDSTRSILGIIEALEDLGEYIRKWELMAETEILWIIEKTTDDSYWYTMFHESGLYQGLAQNRKDILEEENRIRLKRIRSEFILEWGPLIEIFIELLE
jgi:hypothetical protein